MLQVIWLIIICLVVFTNIRKKVQNAQSGQKQPAQPRPVSFEQARAAARQAPIPLVPPAAPAMMPPAPAHDHDHPGSLGDLHDEGYDPCHEDQLAPARDPALEASVPTAPAPAAPLSLSWTRDELVKGFVMGEILAKPRR